MKSLLIAVAIIAFLILGSSMFRSSAGTATSSGSLQESIEFKDQAGLQVEVTNQLNAMRQVVAMGSPGSMVLTTLMNNDSLKKKLETIENNRKNAGTKAQDQLRTLINWAEFLRQDAAMRANVPEIQP